VSSALQLLITLVGVTLLFGCAQANGSIEGAARHALRLCHGRAVLLPPAFFLLAACLAMVGPGAILSTALVAPFAMNAGTRAGVPAFLIALMVANGANAGNLSPFSTVGVVVNGLMTRMGMGGHELRIWFFHGAAHVVVAAAAFLLFGGLRLSGRLEGEELVVPRMRGRHVITLAVTAVWILGVLFLGLPLGWTAFAAAGILLALRVANVRDVFRHIPWRLIALVVSISTGVAFLEKAGGLNWFQDFAARVATPQSIHGVMAFLTGTISAYSSTSGVVLPAFLPLTPGLAERLPGVDPVALAITVNIGSALVDVSPLSTLGALCIAAAPPNSDTALFRKLLLWGLSMTFAGAVICYWASPLFSL
jgi:di/tricarboxylate transporter